MTARAAWERAYAAWAAVEELDTEIQRARAAGKSPRSIVARRIAAAKVALQLQAAALALQEATDG